MWGRILETLDPQVNDALFVNVHALYNLEQSPAKFIADYLSRVRRLFNSLKGMTFDQMTNLFIIVDTDRARFGDLLD